MSAAEKQSAAEALRRIEGLEKENLELKRRMSNLETLLQGRVNPPSAPQIRRPGVVVAGRPAIVGNHPTTLPGVSKVAERVLEEHLDKAQADKPPEPPKAA